MRKRSSNNRRRVLLALSLAVAAPWIVVAAARGLRWVLHAIETLQAWQQTSLWISVVLASAIGLGYLVYKVVRPWVRSWIDKGKRRPRQLGVRFFGGAFVSGMLPKIRTNPGLRFKAVGFAFTPRSIKGDTRTSSLDEPFPCVLLPVREAVRTFGGAEAERNAEEQIACTDYLGWASQHREIVTLLDIVGKGQGFTGLSCLHKWHWLGKPDVFRFLLVVFDLEEAKPQEGHEANQAESDSDIFQDRKKTEQEVLTCVS